MQNHNVKGLFETGVNRESIMKLKEKEKKRSQLPLLLAFNRICHFVSNQGKHFNEKKNLGDASSMQIMIEITCFETDP